MKFKDLSLEVLYILVAAFITSALVSVLYNILIHGSTTVDRTNSVRLSIILAVVIPMVHCRDKKQRKS